MPIDDLPMQFANSKRTSTETIVLPADPQAQWDMVRWTKSRGGVFLADRFGPVWVSGGDAVLASTTDPYQVQISACEGWALEEVNQEDRVGLWVRSTTKILSTSESVLFMLTAQRGMGEIVAFPIVLPNPYRTTTYLEVPEEAGLGVPLCALMADTSGAGYAALHDLRLPPFGLRYRDRNSTGNYRETVAPDASGQWCIFRSHRVWWYAPAGATFEVGAVIQDILPYDTNKDDSGGTRGTKLANANDRGVERRTSLYVNGQLLDGGDLDAAGVKVASGLVAAMHKPWGTPETRYDRLTTYHQTQHVRVVLESQVNAIHDISLAVFIEEGENVEFLAQVHRPQIWVRGVLPQPQFEAGASG